MEMQELQKKIKQKLCRHRYQVAMKLEHVGRNHYCQSSVKTCIKCEKRVQGDEALKRGDSMKYLKNFFVNLATFIVVWLFLIQWFGFRILLTIPVLWWDELKRKFKG